MLAYFLILTLIFIIAQSFGMFFFLKMTNHEGALDIVFGWQKMLERLYSSDNKFLNLLEKILGGCPMCTCFWFAPVWFVLYYLFMSSLDLWVVNGFWGHIVWFISYWNLSAFNSFLLVTKMNKVVTKMNKDGL